MTNKKTMKLIHKNYLINKKRDYIEKELKKLGLQSNHEEQKILILYGSFDRIEMDIIDDMSDTEIYEEKKSSLEDFFNIY